MAQDRKPVRDEAKIEEERSALQTFERILEIMPDDRGALEAAILAAQACEEPEIALTHRLHLADILLAENNLQALSEHVAMLREDDHPRARAWVEAFDAGNGIPSSLSEEDIARAQQGRAPMPPPRSTFNISDEIDLAWKLFEHHEISQEEYAALVRDLTEMSASHNGGTVSVLHTLEASQHKSQDRILSFLAQESEETGSPFISLSCFTMRPDLAHLLPADFMVNRGAIVFETLGREKLVALLNPFNQALRADVQQLCASPCHFFLARASEFDNAIARLKEASEAAG